VKGLPQAAKNHRQRHGGIEIPCLYVIVFSRLKTTKPELWGIIDPLAFLENPDDDQFLKVHQFTQNFYCTKVITSLNIIR
jgi:hypothetical protein